MGPIEISQIKAENLYAVIFSTNSYVKLCWVAGTEDDRGPGGRRPGAALSVPAEGDTGGSGLSGLPAAPGCSGPWPLPHQSGLQRDG